MSNRPRTLDAYLPNILYLRIVKTRFNPHRTAHSLASQILNFKVPRKSRNNFATRNKVKFNVWLVSDKVDIYRPDALRVSSIDRIERISEAGLYTREIVSPWKRIHARPTLSNLPMPNISSPRRSPAAPRILHPVINFEKSTCAISSKRV